MLEKLKKVEEKFDFISAELCKSEVVSDMELYKKYMQELKHLSPIVEKYREYKAAENNAEEAKNLLEESGAASDDQRDMSSRVQWGSLAATDFGAVRQF